ncbi:SIR2 family protein [Pantoea sp. At-9b]|uniref:SIR2 family protein n=1 Tax=Pantoea sp. (strain At-9b) TaxID=592316 RepID=UPI0001F25EB1|nr:SIR2 family protein [Pantoea sp. At-9b]ADU69570.1 TIR protein [Pantoea sp. At-9b]
MKIYLNYSRYDESLAVMIKESLASGDIEVVSSSLFLSFTNNVATKKVIVNEQEKLNYDVVFNILTNSFFKSKYAVNKLNETILNNGKIFNIVFDDLIVPDYLNAYPYYRLKPKGINSFRQLVKHLNLDSFVSLDLASPPLKNDEVKEITVIDKIKLSLNSGKLTLFCGAGTSLDAGIPTWNKLLDNLFVEMLDVIKKQNENLKFDIDTVKDSDVSNSVSPLILAKYIKNNVKTKFNEVLRNALYKENPTTCDLINAIAEISRPRRDGRSIDSIITFNFDGLIEERLSSERIKYKAIHSESVKFTSNELPIYHVHGFLPRDGDIDNESNVVFSEDGYHSQFMEPFSWSNIIQLQKLTQNVCLFVGISLTDPNMRRLLDVAWRKSTDDNLEHFIIKKSPKQANSESTKFVMYLEEQDANELGLNVLWVDDYKDIPKLLLSLNE